jgi:DMSO reductase anchor subunit
VASIFHLGRTLKAWRMRRNNIRLVDETAAG